MANKKKTVKKATKKMAAKKAAPKAVKAAVKKPAAKQKGAGLMKPKTLNAALESVVGKGPMSRPEIIKKIWEYIKANGLQDTTNKRMINADEKLLVVFGGEKQVNMFSMAKYISACLS